MSGKAKALIVCESLAGSTRLVAEEIGKGIGKDLMIEIVEVSKAPEQLYGSVALLIIGGAPQAFGSTRPTADRPVPTPDSGLRKWLGGLTGSANLAAAAFDTRPMHSRRLPGSAANGAATLLAKRGYTLVSTPHSFWLKDATETLAIGEAARARRWGDDLAAALEKLRNPGPAPYRRTAGHTG
ncbi:flavodoxin [Kribbella monticola]|uniref:flavodoxin n=1 Tax=Kribbella monticola TaxID=2185285 RepID=UPI0013001961|nr:flavodoxin [Kribbella monticola]